MKGEKTPRKTMKWRVKVNKVWGLVAVSVAVFISLFFLPMPEDGYRGGVSVARTVSWYELSVPGVDTLYFMNPTPDSLLLGLSSKENKAHREFLANAFFISFSGRLATVADTLEMPDSLLRPDLLPFLRKEAERIRTGIREHHGMLGEMAYYERTHSVVDEGFHQVMAYGDTLQGKCAELERLLACVDSVLAGAGAVALLHRVHGIYVLQRADSVSCRVSLPCSLQSENEGGASVWQVEGGVLPPYAVCFRLNPFPYSVFHSCRHLYAVWGYLGKHRHALLSDTAVAEKLEIRMNRNHPCIPLVGGVEGSPVSGTYGCLNGMMVRGRCATAWELYALQLENSSWWVCFWEDLRAWALRMKWKIGGFV